MEPMDTDCIGQNQKIQDIPSDKTLSGGATSCKLTGLSGYTYFKLIPYRNVNGGKWNLPISAFYTHTYYY